MDSAKFDLIARQAIEGPEGPPRNLQNVEVIVYDSRNKRQSGKHWKEEADSYGLIEGRHFGDLAQDPGGVEDLMPTRIILFKRTIE